MPIAEASDVIFVSTEVLCDGPGQVSAAVSKEHVRAGGKNDGEIAERFDRARTSL